MSTLFTFTEFTYAYHDYTGRESVASVILRGKLTEDDISPYLYQGHYFVPADVGLAPLNGISEDDHPWHEPTEFRWAEDESLLTPWGLDGGGWLERGLSLDEFLNRFRTAFEAGWPGQYDPPRTGDPYSFVIDFRRTILPALRERDPGLAAEVDGLLRTHRLDWEKQPPKLPPAERQERTRLS